MTAVKDKEKRTAFIVEQYFSSANTLGAFKSLLYEDRFVAEHRLISESRIPFVVPSTNIKLNPVKLL